MAILTKNGSELFFEPFFKTFFHSSPLAVLEAEYDFNRGISIGTNLGDLAYFYRLLDLEPPPGSGDVGWNSDYLALDWAAAWVDFIHKPGITDDGKPYCEISYPMEPKPMDYYQDYDIPFK